VELAASFFSCFIFFIQKNFRIFTENFKVDVFIRKIVRAKK
jgi:hypothetical protein